MGLAILIILIIAFLIAANNVRKGTPVIHENMDTGEIVKMWPEKERVVVSDLEDFPHSEW